MNVKFKPYDPLDADSLLLDKDVLSYFDVEHRLYDNFSDSATIILGRRGSGKTAFIKYQQVSAVVNGGIGISINKSKILTQIISAVEDINPKARFPESVAEIWERVIYTIIFQKSLKSGKIGRTRYIRDYLGKISASEKPETIDDIAWNVLHILKDTKTTKGLGVVADFIMKLNKVNFNDAKRELRRILKANPLEIVVVIDSLESEAYMMEDNVIASVMTGLLKFINSPQRNSEVIRIIMCLPDEYRKSITRASSNPVKDLSSIFELR